MLALPAAPGVGMRLAGVTVPLTMMQAQQIAVILEPYTGGDPWWGSPGLSSAGSVVTRFPRVPSSRASWSRCKPTPRSTGAGGGTRPATYDTDPSYACMT